MKSSVGTLYVFIRMEEMVGHTKWMLGRAVFRLSKLKELLPLAMIRPVVSLMPIGFTLGFLSRVMRRQANGVAMLTGMIRIVHGCLAASAEAWQRKYDAVLNDVLNLLQP